jgi:hypothetical protein
MKPRLFNVLTFTDPLVIVTPAGRQRLHEMILLPRYGMGVVLRPVWALYYAPMKIR